MEKSYLLLRNNKQLGPFTIDELLQQQLQPTDLVWVEEQSVAWCFPSQIRELNKDFVFKNNEVEEQEVTTLPVQKIEDVVYEESLEKRAEALRNRILSQQKASSSPLSRSNSIYAQASYGYLKDREVEVTYHSNKEYVTLPQLLAAGAMTAIIGTAFFSGWMPIKSNSNVNNAAVAPLITTEENAAKAAPVVTTISPASIANDSLLVTSQQVDMPKVRKSGIEKADTISPAADIAQAEVTPQTATETVKEPVTKKEEATVVSVPEVKNETIDDANGSVEKEEPKKKGFLRNLFKKKKKDKEETETVE